MARLGGMYGPDVTFLGVPRADLADPGTWAGAEVLIIGAPFDGGTSHRPGARFGPQAIRCTDYLPHDGTRPHLALGVDPLAELRVADAGDVEMPSGETEASLARLEHAVLAACEAGAIPVGPLFAQAIEDALSLRERGIELNEIPLSPSRLWELTAG